MTIEEMSAAVDQPAEIKGFWVTLYSRTLRACLEKPWSILGLSFGGLITVNLGVMNLLPIPGLDGARAVGVLLTTLIECITRKKVNPRYEGYIQSAGTLVLFALLIVIMFKDVIQIFRG